MTTRPLLLLALVAAVCLTGCAGTRTFRPDDARFTRRHIDGRSGTVTLRSGIAYRAKALHVTPDSLLWVDEATLARSGVPAHDVTRVDVRSPRLTVGRTALAGVLVGVLAGTVIGYAVARDFDVTPNEALGPALVVGAFGMPSGAVYGALGGALSPATWTFVPVLLDTSSRLRPVVP